jgi:hypothetical protein
MIYQFQNHTPLPCIDCITLPICLSIFRDKYKLENRHFLLLTLIERCSLIEKYICPDKFIDVIRESHLSNYMKSKMGLRNTYDVLPEKCFSL